MKIFQGADLNNAANKLARYFTEGNFPAFTHNERMATVPYSLLVNRERDTPAWKDALRLYPTTASENAINVMSERLFRDLLKDCPKADDLFRRLMLSMIDHERMYNEVRLSMKLIHPEHRTIQ